MSTCHKCGRARALRAFGLCHTCYTAMRRAAIDSGTWESVMIPADRGRDHVKRLLAEGYTIRFISELARVDEQSVSRLASGEHKMIMMETEERVCGVPVHSLWDLWKTEDRPHRMPSEPIARRIRALAADGWTYPEIGKPLGWTRALVGRYATTPPKWSMSSLTRRVDEVYRSPEFAVPVRKARADVARKKWPRPLDWDDIDSPQASQIANSRASRRLG